MNKITATLEYHLYSVKKSIKFTGKKMNNVTLEILLIALIFVLGIILCFQTSIFVGIGFIVLANIALPTIIKFSQISVSGFNKLQQR